MEQDPTKMERDELYYDLKNLYHNNRMTESVTEMFCNQHLTDCTLIAEGKSLNAHRVILAAASEYLLNAFNTLPDAGESEIATITVNNARFDDLFNVIKFIYCGKVTVSEDNLVGFMDVGNMLKVRGIVDMSIDINREKTTACQNSSSSSNEAGSSKEAKQAHKDDNKNGSDDEIAPRTRHTRKRQHANEPQNESDDDLPIATRQFKRARSSRSYRHIPLLIETDEEELLHCCFCERSFHNKSTLSNHERFCESNPNRKLSTCPICGKIVKPGSMTFHKKSQHNYVPKSRKRQSIANDGPSARKDHSGSRKSRRSAVKDLLEDPIEAEMQRIHEPETAEAQSPVHDAESSSENQFDVIEQEYEATQTAVEQPDAAY